MKSYRQELWFNLPARMELVNITPQVETCVAESGIREGLCLVNAMHITASVFINDDEPGLVRDYKKWLEELAPFDPSPERYHHNRLPFRDSECQGGKQRVALGRGRGGPGYSIRLSQGRPGQSSAHVSRATSF